MLKYELQPVLSAADQIYRWQRSLRALQLLRDAVHPHALSQERDGHGGKWRQGSRASIHDRSLLFAAVRRLARRPLAGTLPHHPLPFALLLFGSRRAGLV